MTHEEAKKLAEDSGLIFSELDDGGFSLVPDQDSDACMAHHPDFPESFYTVAEDFTCRVVSPSGAMEFIGYMRQLQNGRQT